LGKRDKRSFAQSPPPQQRRRIPRAPIVDSTNDEQCSPCWLLSCVDLDGEWSWNKATEAQLRQVHGLLQKYEGMRWDEIKKQKNTHPMPPQRLVTQARNRLERLQYDDVDTLYQLGGMGLPRIWGIRFGRALALLWFDPEHTVYPIEH
jgi:hypothetical protein